jgi:cell division protein FtsN
MGYVLGQSSPKSAKVAPETAAAVAPNNAPDARPQASAPAETAPTPPVQATDTAPPVAAPPVEAPPQPTTVPAHDASAAPPPKAPAVADPGNASYWQVTASASKSSAEAVYQTLKDKGFPALTRQGPNNLTVVWVGPYFDRETLTKAKKQLEDAGFNPPIKKP